MALLLSCRKALDRDGELRGAGKMTIIEAH
jgi:hypothetical protein